MIRSGSRLGARELTSLDERLGLLLLVRVALVAVAVLAAGFTHPQVGFDIPQVGPVSAVYLVVAAGAEAYRRSHRRGRMRVHRAVLPLDAVYLAIITTPAGGPRSPLVVLFAVQLIAVTLLASERAGIRMALWDSFLFVTIPTLSLSPALGSLLRVHEIAEPPTAETALAIMGFWVVAVCTAFFASVSERELRRTKAELEALAGMASDLELLHNEEEILSTLIRTVVDSFPFDRGALWWSRGERLAGLTVTAAGKVTEVVVKGGENPDRIATDAWAARDALLVRRLDPVDDPVASALLRGAINVVVLPIQIEGRESGIALFEYGGNPFQARLQRRTLIMLMQFCAHAGLSLRNARLLAERERQAAIDGLTGLANRREFDNALAREVSRARRTKEPLSLVVIDVDHFKQINDRSGHLAGDEVLRAIAQAIASSVREMDLAARYGGEEFALVLPGCESGDAVDVMRRVRAAVKGASELAGVTVSAGIATMPDNAGGGEALVAAADDALYASKRSGRNRFTVSAHQARAPGVGPRGRRRG